MEMHKRSRQSERSNGDLHWLAICPPRSPRGDGEQDKGGQICQRPKTRPTVEGAGVSRGEPEENACQDAVSEQSERGATQHLFRIDQLWRAADLHRDQAQQYARPGSVLVHAAARILFIIAPGRTIIGV